MSRVFIIGHARSGTTALLNILNTSPDMYMLGEANFYRTGNEQGFRNWFNAQHEGWGNQATKSAYAPLIPHLSEEATGNEYLRALEERVVFAGEKVVLGDEESGHDFDRLRDWLEGEQWFEKVVFALRSPRAVVASCVRLYDTSIPTMARSVAKTLQLAVHLARIYPKIAFVVHESVTRESIQALGSWIGIDLGPGSQMYHEDRITAPGFGHDTPYAGLLDRLEAAYGLIVGELGEGRLHFDATLAQRDQTRPGHPPLSLNPLGAAVRALDGICREVEAMRALETARQGLSSERQAAKAAELTLAEVRDAALGEWRIWEAAEQARVAAEQPTDELPAAGVEEAESAADAPASGEPSAKPAREPAPAAVRAATPAKPRKTKARANSGKAKAAADVSASGTPTGQTAPAAMPAAAPAKRAEPRKTRARANSGKVTAG